jgi:hypothetical protein
LTLALPLLMFVLCLMINFGVIGAWKVRAQAATRYAGWGTVAERTGQFNPPPPNWPASALWEELDGPNLPDVDRLWNSDAALLAECLRGPQLASPHGTPPVNVPGRLEMDDEVQRGHAVLDRPVPLLRGATPTGRFRFDLTQDLFDNRWQFFTMGFPSNESIRLRVWYDIEHGDLAMLDGDIAEAWSDVQELAAELINNPRKCRLFPLDRDPEFQRYRGSWPDFYPRARRDCSLEIDAVEERVVRALVRAVQDRPRVISNAFGSLYERWIRELEACGYNDAEIQPMRDRYNDLRGLNGMGSLMRGMCPPGAICPCPPSPVQDDCP